MSNTQPRPPDTTSPLWMKVPIMLEPENPDTGQPGSLLQPAPPSSSRPPPTATLLQPNVHDSRRGASPSSVPVDDFTRRDMPNLRPNKLSSMQDGTSSLAPASMASWQWPLAENAPLAADRPGGRGAQSGPYASPPQGNLRHASPNAYEEGGIRTIPRGPGTRHRSRNSVGGAPIVPLNLNRGFGPGPGPRPAPRQGPGPGPGPPPGRQMRSPPSHGILTSGPSRATARPLSVSNPNRIAPTPSLGLFSSTPQPRPAPPIPVPRSNSGFPSDSRPPQGLSYATPNAGQVSPFKNALPPLPGAAVWPLKVRTREKAHTLAKSLPLAGLAHPELATSSLGETARLIKSPESTGSANSLASTRALLRNPQPAPSLPVIDEKPGVEEESEESLPIRNPPADAVVHHHPNTHSFTKVYDLVQTLETIPRLHNILVSLFTWLILLGFVILPGAFMSSSRVVQAEAQGAAAGKGSSTPSSMTVSSVLGFLFVAAGIAGTAWLAAKWHKNYLWLINKLYLPTMLNALAGMIATIVAVATQQAGSWNAQAAVTIVIEVAVLTVTSVMFGAYNYWLNQKLSDGQVTQGVPRSEASRSNNGSTWSSRAASNGTRSRKASLVQRMRSFRSARSVAPGSVV